jgi:hypothetical protein
MGPEESGFIYWQQSEETATSRADDTKIPLIHCQKPMDSEPFRGGHNGSVGKAEVEITISSHQLSNPREIFLSGSLEGKCTGDQILDKAKLSIRPEEFSQEVVHFAEDSGGNKDRSCFVFDDPSNRDMVLVIGVKERVDPTGIGNQRHRDFLAAFPRISSA